MQSYIFLYNRDIDRLLNELEAFGSESTLWLTRGDVTNTAGNLVLHLVGNLRHFIGHIMGQTDYTRDRDYEFAAKNVSREELKNLVIQAKKEVDVSLSDFDPNSLSSTYPIEVFGSPMTYEYFLIHLNGHLNYHLGQINYLRRIIEG